MQKTKIQWAEAVWNPVRGCLRVSPGCGGPSKFGGCYAERIAARFSGPGQPYEGFAERKGGEARWTGKVALIEDKLTEPLTWRKPTRVFANSMSDLFHESLPDEAIDRVFAVMALAPQHTFQVLTKRSARMRGYLSMARAHPVALAAMEQTFSCMAANPKSQVGASCVLQGDIAHLQAWPLPNVWLGVSCEDQPRADERIPDLLATPAAMRFCSAEPLLGEIDFRNLYREDEEILTDAFEGMSENGVVDAGDRLIAINPVYYKHAKLNMVIVGAESGPRARPMELQWARDIVSQCQSAGVAVFVKQLSGPGGRAIKDMAAFPTDLRIREFPRATP